MENRTVAPQKEIKRIRELVLGFGSARIVMTANNLNLFEAMGDRSLTPEEIAEELNLDKRGIDLFLRSLTSLKLLAYDNGRFSNTFTAKQLFFSQSPYYQGHIIKLYHFFWHNWSYLDHIITDGVKSLEDIPYRFPHVFSKNKAVVESYIRGMQEVAKLRYRTVVDKIDLNGVATMLDIGGGHGIYSMGMVLKNPRLKVKILDRDYCEPIIAENVQEFKVAENVTFVEGDYTTDDLGGPYEAIFLSNIVRGHDESENLALLEKIHAALADSGRLIIQDTLSHLESEMQSVYAAIHSINMLVNTTGGKIYTVAEICRLLDRSGFSRPEHIRVDDMSSLVIAGKH